MRSKSNRKLVLALWIGAGLTLLASVGLLGSRLLSGERATVLASAEASVRAIAEFRGESIRHWLAERRAGVDLQALASRVAQPAISITHGDRVAAHRLELRDELDRLERECTDCLIVRVQDLAGRTLASTGQDRARTTLSAAPGAPPPSGSLRIDQATGAARLVLVGQIRHDDDGKDQVFGHLVVELDPAIRLYPLFQSWPFPSRSGEVLLLERRGEEVVVLNQPRHQPATAHLLQLPLSGITPAARAARGETEDLSGVDYRGVEVIAAARTIQGTALVLVAKEDLDEVLAGHYERVRLYAVVLLGLLLAGAGTFAFVLQHFRARSLRAHERGLASELEEARLWDQELARRELRFRSLALATSQIVWSTNAAGEVVDDLPSWRTYTGMTREETSGAGWLAAIHPDDAGRAEQAWRQAVSARSHYSVNFRIRGADGQYRTFEHHGVPVHDPDGHITEWIGTCTDISPRLVAEEALRASEVYQRRLIESLGVGVVVHGADTRIVTSNREASRVLGLSSDQLRGRTAIDPAWRFLGEDGAPLPVELFPVSRVVASRQPFSGQVLGVDRTDGTPPRWALVNAYPTWDGKGQLEHIVVSFSDITSQRNAETEAARLAEHLRVSQKIEAIGRLAGGVAHDFNNILSVILGHTAFALESVGEDHPLREDLVEVEKAGRRAAALTSQLLAFGRRQVLQPRPIGLNGVVVELEKMLRRVIGEDIQLELSLAAGLWPTLADPAQVEQVIMNLVINARDAMPGGGRLSIATANLLLVAGTGSALPPGSYVELSVTDTGVGIDAATRARLFEPFFTTKAVGKGTGLGLSTVYGIVSQSGGEVQVESQPGHGATFRILLPRAPPVAPERASPPEARQSPALATGSETILVVEDEAAVRDVARRILEAAGFRVLTADSGIEALRTCQDEVGEIHLLLSDVVMPKMGGLECADLARRLRPGLRVLFMSGYAAEAITEQGVLHANLRLLGKPFSAAELTRQVREALDGPPTAAVGDLQGGGAAGPGTPPASPTVR